MQGQSKDPDYRKHLITAVRTIERLEERLATSRDPWLDEPIALIGMGCRFPGGANTPEDFWDLLRHGVDATSEFPSDRADARSVYDDDPDAPGKAYTVRGGFIDRVDRFEPEVFGITPREARGMDPQHRIALEVTWEALERAGYAPDALDGSRTGVYLGISTTDYVRLRQQIGDVNDIDAYQLVGEPSFLAGRISYSLGLRGPSQVVDTACSSSLVALHDACQALRLRQCDMALAGGVNLMLAPYGFVLMSKFRALSPDGRCKSFSANADGYARGEGAGVVVLRRLSDALADGDHILGVVRGTAVNHDGRSSGLTVPNPAAQQDMLRAALAQASIEPHQVDYVEAHGTGTSLGDPIELRALDAVLGQGRSEDASLLVGTVKTNIGHLEPAAGVAGLIKLVLALQHGEIPPSLHFDEPNPNIAWDRLKVEVAEELRPWPARGTTRVGGVSSFGVSGTNAHAVVSSTPALSGGVPGGDAANTRPHGLFVASARTEPALRELAARYVRHLRREPGLNLADLCWTTHVGRARQATGLAVVAGSVDELADHLEVYAQGRTSPALATSTLPAYKYRKAAWLFTGQGAQYAGMGRELLAEPAFAAAFDQAEQALDAQLDRPLRDVLWPVDGQDTPIDDTRYTQPALFAVEYALAKAMMAWGPAPAALAGHSVGEIAAACVAGVFSVTDAARLVVTRARLMAELPAGGVMVALRCDEATARAAVSAHGATVSIAAVNAPDEVVISGADADVSAVGAMLESQGVKGRRLTVSHAFHSPLLTPMVDAFRETLRTLSYAKPKVPLVSNLTGTYWTDAEVGPEYWVRHALGAVRFADTVTALHADGFRTFCEIGPAPILTSLGRRCLGDDTVFVPTLRRGDDARRRLLQAVGTLRLRGANVDWEAFHEGERVRRVPLPTTPWHGDSYWFDEVRRAPDTSAASASPVADAAEPVYSPLPGLRRLASAVPTYQLATSDEHWSALARADAEGRPHLSLSTLVGTALAVAENCLGGRFSAVVDAELTAPLPLDDERTVQLVVTEGEDGRARCEYRSIFAAEERAGAAWRLHAYVVLRRRLDTAQLTQTLAAAPTLDEAAYQAAPTDGEQTLPMALRELRHGDDGLLATLDGSPDWSTLLGVLAAVGARAAQPEVEHTTETTGVRRVQGLTCFAPNAVRHLRIRTRRTVAGQFRVAVDFFDSKGGYLGGCDRIRFAATDRAATPMPWRDVDELMYDVTWDHTVPTGDIEPADLTGEGFLLLAGGAAEGLAERLATVLRDRGAQTVVAAPPVSGVAGACVPDAEGVRATLAHWCATVRRPSRIVLLTGLGAPLLDHADAWGLEEYAARGELLTVALLKELARRDDCPDTRLTVVTRGAMPAGPGGEVTGAVAHTLWGLGRVIALESPERWGGAIDLNPLESPADVDRLVAALGRTALEDEQALRGADVHVPRLVPRKADPSEQRRAPAVRPDGTYLITGAFGAIGLALAQWLALAGAGRLVLLGRTPLPDRSEWSSRLPASVRARVKAVLDLERLGVEVTVVAADVADEAAMLGVFEELGRHPLPLRGIAHAAGVSLPQFLKDVDAAAYRNVWRPKVIGGWLLHQLSRGAELDFFLGFSSIAATWGSQHLASYSAGNAFLEGLAHQRRTEGLPALTVAWGPWELDSNLFDEEVMAFLTSTGLHPLSGGQCLHLLGGLLASDRAHQVVCAVDWSIYKPVMEARIERPVFRAIVPDEVGDDQVQDAESLVEKIAASASDERRALIDAFARETAAAVAGVEPDTIDADQDVLDYGLDSLMVMDVVRQCRRRLGISIRASQLFEHSTLADWSELLHAEFSREHDGADPATPGNAGSVPAAAGQSGDPTDPAWLRDDVSLDPAIQPPTGAAAFPARQRHLLLTGATGFLGAHLLDELLRRTEATVHCLVRCADPDEGLRRIRANYEQYLTWPAAADGRITVVPGDLEKPMLGLTEQAFDELGVLLDGIYHNGAWVNFSYTYAQLRRANLAGTEEILRLACRGRLTPVHHVSTYGIWGIPADGRTVIGESDSIAGAGRLVTGYVQTKWAAERLVELGRERGIPIDLYRPGRVLGNSRTGAALATHFTIKVIKGCIQLGMVPDLDLDIEMTPVDYVTSALVAIAIGKTDFGTNYHLLNRHKMRFAELGDVLRARWQVRLVPVDEWWQALRASYGVTDNELHTVMDVVEEFIVSGEEAIDYDDKNTEAALAATGITCPPLDHRLLDTYFGWLSRTGHLPEPARTHS